MEEFTTNELLNHLGLSSVGTIQKWKRNGLIPEPSVRQVETGRGRKAFWLESVLDRCVEIRRLVKTGKTLDEIKQILPELETEAKRSKRKYRFSEVSAQMEHAREHFKMQDFVLRQVRHTTRHHLGNTDYETFSWQHFEKALVLSSQGFNPVFVMTNKLAAVVTDVDVSHLLARDEIGMVLVVPLGQIVRELRPGDQVKFRPSDKIIEQLKNGKVRERKHRPAK